MLSQQCTMQDVVVSSDGQFALSGSWDGTLRLWDLNNGSTTRRFVGHTKDVLSVAFSHDNRYDLLPFLCASFLAPVPSVSKRILFRLILLRSVPPQPDPLGLARQEHQVVEHPRSVIDPSRCPCFRVFRVHMQRRRSPTPCRPKQHAHCADHPRALCLLPSAPPPC